jgi:hypothetical protein
MRILILGDSHIAAYRAALDGGYRGPDGVTFAFFGAPANRLSRLTLKDRVLGTTNTTIAEKLVKLWGASSFDLADIDLVALVGLGSNARLLGPLYKAHRTDAMAEGDFLVSEDTFDLAVEGLLRASLFGRVVEILRAGDAPPVIGLPQPLPSPELLVQEPKNWIGTAISNGDGDRLRLAVERAHTRLGLHAVIAQPEETLHAPLLTRIELMQSGVRLNDSKEADDLSHANADYAALVLDRMFAELGTPA